MDNLCTLTQILMTGVSDKISGLVFPDSDDTFLAPKPDLSGLHILI